MLSVTDKSFMLSDIIILNVVMLSVIMLNVMALIQVSF